MLELSNQNRLDLLGRAVFLRTKLKISICRWLPESICTLLWHRKRTKGRTWLEVQVISQKNLYDRLHTLPNLCKIQFSKIWFVTLQHFCLPWHIVYVPPLLVEAGLKPRRKAEARAVCHPEEIFLTLPAVATCEIKSVKAASVDRNWETQPSQEAYST